jgi:hypothetical protein
VHIFEELEEIGELFSNCHSDVNKGISWRAPKPKYFKFKSFMISHADTTGIKLFRN